MQIIRTYLDKCNTITKDNAANVSLNPVMELNYGNVVSRGIIHFNLDKVQKLIDDKVIIPDKLKHRLRMINTASLTSVVGYDKMHSHNGNYRQERAISFGLVFFRIPKPWDSGRGYDFTYIAPQNEFSKRTVSSEGSNWYRSRTYEAWDEEGIYSATTLENMITDYCRTGKSDTIISIMNFDCGNENIDLDLTDLVNNMLAGKIENNGIGIAFLPKYETSSREDRSTQYVGFFTTATHTFFKPYLETTYDDTIQDDRLHFYLDKVNRLYFYASVGGSMVNLDELPICTVEGREMASKQATTGVYYVEFELPSNEYEDEVILNDVWGNIVYKGVPRPEVELEFVTKTNTTMCFGLPSAATVGSTSNISPTIYGVNEEEVLNTSEIRKINVECRVPYSSTLLTDVEELSYRIYVDQGTSQYEVYPWIPVEIGYNEMYFMLRCMDLLPFTYHIDLRLKKNREITVWNDCLTFKIIDDRTDMFV